MRGGFFSGLIIGTVVGTISSMVMGPEYRHKARGMVNQGNQLFDNSPEGVQLAESWLERGRRLFQKDNQPTGEMDYSECRPANQMGDDILKNEGKENISRRVAILEQRLEELSQRGV